MPSTRKIFLTDLDGTLLTDRKTISPKTREALDAFVAAGNVFAISTGRALENALHIQKSFDLCYPGSFVIGFNGSQIYDYSNQKTIYRASVDFDTTREILALAAEWGIHCHTYNDRYIVSPAYNEQLTYYRTFIKSPAIITDHVMEELPNPPCKLIAIELHDRAKIERFRDELSRRYGSFLTTIFSNDYYLEIFSKEAGKGAALHRLSEYLGIPRENTMAAGDAENDLSMIQEAGIGIAMCNGSETIRNAADQVTKTDNNHDGLVPFLR